MQSRHANQGARGCSASKKKVQTLQKWRLLKDADPHSQIKTNPSPDSAAQKKHSCKKYVVVT